jgi:hypothetical protein
MDKKGALVEKNANFSAITYTLVIDAQEIITCTVKLINRRVGWKEVRIRE